MPLYEYRCRECGEIEEAYRRVATMLDSPQCQICGGETSKILSASRVHGDLAPYYDDNLQSYVNGKDHRRKLMKEQGVEEHYGQNWYTSGVKKRHT